MRLREAIRDVDVVARQGGDEFLLLLADLSSPPGSHMAANPRVSAEAVAGRVMECFRRPFFIGGVEVFVTASGGVALHPESADSAEALLKQADAIMYESKRSGPGQFLVHTDQTIPSPLLSLTTRLRRAVEARQWLLHYQPVVELSSERMSGVEALIRWRSPHGGLIQPGEFIPLAEELGLIAAIGDWVVGELAEQLSDWQRRGIAMRASFNLSPRQLRQPNLVERIVQRLDEHRVDPASVVVEITESAAMVDPDRTQHIFEELRRLGVGLAIDDFGTGYSSLSRLRHLPVDILKIDRSFVSEVPTDPDASAMVAAFVQLAHTLGIVPLAEGIETPRAARLPPRERLHAGPGVPLLGTAGRGGTGGALRVGSHPFGGTRLGVHVGVRLEPRQAACGAEVVGAARVRRAVSSGAHLHRHPAHGIERLVDLGRGRSARGGDSSDRSRRAELNQLGQHGHGDLGVGDPTEIEPGRGLHPPQILVREPPITEVRQDALGPPPRRDQSDIGRRGLQGVLQRLLVVVALCSHDDDGSLGHAGGVEVERWDDRGDPWVLVAAMFVVHDDGTPPQRTRHLGESVDGR